MKINKEVLKKLNPCIERWKNYLTHYPDFDGSFDEFIDLENISYDDKVWVAKNLLNKNQMVHFGLFCAEGVLPNFEKEFPNDKRVRECIELLKSFGDFSNLTENQKAAARSAAESAARSAVWAAAWAAESEAWAARSARSAARSAESAAWAAESAAWLMQENINLTLLKMAANL